MTNATSETSSDRAVQNLLVARTRAEWSALQGRWSTLAAGVQSSVHLTWDVLRERLLAVLDVPSRDELDKLSARLAELEARLATPVALSSGAADSGAEVSADLDGDEPVTVDPVTDPAGSKDGASVAGPSLHTSRVVAEKRSRRRR